MARVIYGGSPVDFIGSIGGVTFQHNPAGKVVHQKTNKTHFQSAKQQLQFQNITYFSRLWITLPDPTKYDWNTFARANPFTDKYGHSKTLTGQQYFISINVNAKLMGNTVQTIPPVYFRPSAVPTYTFNVWDIGISMTFAAPFTLTGQYLFIYTSCPVRYYELQPRKNWQLTAIIPPGTYNTISLTSFYNTAQNLNYSTISVNASFHVNMLCFICDYNSCITGDTSFSSTPLTVYTPFPMTDLKLWLDPAKGVTMDLSNNVSEWDDQSIALNNVYQANPLNQPLFVASGLNGLPCIRFNGSTSFLLSALSNLYAQPNTLFIVWSTSSAANGFVFDGNTPSQRNCVFFSANNIYSFAGNYYSYGKAQPFSVLTSVIYNGASSFIYDNGIQQATNNAGADGLQQILLGHECSLSNYFNGDISEIIFFNKLLNTTDRNLVELYLRLKYGF